MSRREKNDQKNLNRRNMLELCSVACSVMGLGFGAVEVANRPYTDRNGNTVWPEPADLMEITKAQGGVLVETTVPVRWEITDNRGAIVAWA